MTLVAAIAILLVAASAPGTVELLLLTVAGLFYRPPSADASGAGVVVVVPAHNESLHIGRCVRSLKDSAASAPGCCEIVVVADNCDDDTAERARQAGARVLERQDPHRRGKGYALDHAFRTLIDEAHQAFMVVDADSVVSDNFIARCAGLFAAGADAVQCRYTTLNASSSLRTRLMNVALMAFNVLRPRGRAALGLSAGIFGNGFGLSASLLRAVPYEADSVVEDLEYHLRLVEKDYCVAYCDDAWVKADMPSGGSGSRTQRARWEGGRLLMLRQHLGSLLGRVAGGRWRLLEPALDLMLLPLAYHVLLLGVVLALPFGPTRWYAAAALAVVVLHVVVAIRVGGGGWRELAVLLLAPFYIVWKLTVLRLIGRTSSGNAAWVRTRREGAAEDRDD